MIESRELQMNQHEITYKELLTMDKDEYVLIDMRDDGAVAYGMIPDAKHIPHKQIEEKMDELPQSKALVFYCARGIISQELAEQFTNEGYRAYSLAGGYGSWLIHVMEMEKITEDTNRLMDIEKSIQKKYRKPLFSRFAKAINEYELLQENDKIAVCISGGKDSMLMAKLFQELQRHRKFHFELVFLVMDPGYNEENRKMIEHNAELLGIPITVFETNIFDTVFEVDKSPCYLCARMRRGSLYSKAKALGCNKIALGHHYDDVIETILMSMLYGAQIQTMMPKLHSKNFEGMELIRPMYLIREDDIKRWRDSNDLHFIQCACRFTQTCSTGNFDGESIESSSKRMEIKKLIKSIKQYNPLVENHIFRSVENVHLDAIIGYKDKHGLHHFLDHYDSVKQD